jgi:hypothetical protein
LAISARIESRLTLAGSVLIAASTFRSATSGVVLAGDQPVQPRHHPLVEAAGHQSEHGLLGLVEGGADDLGGAPRGRGFDELGPAPGQERLDDAVLPPLRLGDVTGQPVGELTRVRHAARG